MEMAWLLQNGTQLILNCHKCKWQILKRRWSNVCEFLWDLGKYLVDHLLYFSWNKVRQWIWFASSRMYTNFNYLSFSMTYFLIIFMTNMIFSINWYFRKTFPYTIELIFIYHLLWLLIKCVLLFKLCFIKSKKEYFKIHSRSTILFPSLANTFDL